MSDLFPDTPAAGLTFRKSKIDGIAALGELMTLFCGALDRHSFLAGIAGTEIYAVSVLRVQAKGGLSALFETAAALPFLFTVGSKDSTAAIKNAGAFAPVAIPILLYPAVRHLV